MARIIDLYFESDDVAIASGSPLVPGTDTRDVVIPDGEDWFLEFFGGTSSQDDTEVILLYSDDGETFINPWDGAASNNRLRKLHLCAGISSEVRLPFRYIFQGDGTRMLRIIHQNYNTVDAAEIISWLSGEIK